MTRFSSPFIFIALLWSLTTNAYLLPSQFLLENWANKHSLGIKVLKLRSTITAYEKGKPTPLHFKETIYYSPSLQTLKGIVTDDAEQKLYSIEKTIESLSPICKLLLSTDAAKLGEVLKGQGIPIRTKEELLALPTEAERLQVESESLVRVQGQLTRLAYVISTAKNEPGSLTNLHLPQIWFDKETLFPIKIIYQEIRDQNFYEFLFEDFRLFRDWTYPKSVQVKKGEDILFSIQLVDLLIAPPDHPGIKLSRTPNSENGFSNLGLSGSNDLKNLILQYYGIFR